MAKISICRSGDRPTDLPGLRLAPSSQRLFVEPSAGTRRRCCRTLKTCAERIKAGEPIEMVLEEGRAQIELAEFALDYLEARHALTLAPIVSLKEGPIRLLVAAKIGTTRLIDNLGV